VILAAHQLRNHIEQYAFSTVSYYLLHAAGNKIILISRANDQTRDLHKADRQ
jgi:putative heme iron utilization protein